MTTGGVPGAPELTEQQIRAGSRGKQPCTTPYVAARNAPWCGGDQASGSRRRPPRSSTGSLMDDRGRSQCWRAVRHLFGGRRVQRPTTSRRRAASLAGGADVLRKKRRDDRRAGAPATRSASRPASRSRFGTDSGILPARPQTPGSSPTRCAVGQSPIEAIRSATLLCGRDDRLVRPRRRPSRPGCFADLVGLKGNPLDDVTLLESVDFVMAGGRVVVRDS